MDSICQYQRWYFDTSDRDKRKDLVQDLFCYDSSNLIKHLQTRHNAEYMNASSQFNSLADKVYISKSFFLLRLIKLTCVFLNYVKHGNNAKPF